MKMMTETKVGLLVIAALGGIIWLSAQTGSFGSHSSKELRILETEFTDADGVGIGSKVKMAGIQVGEVTDVHLNRNGYATLVMGIRKDIPYPENVVAQIATSGLIGEKFIALTTDFAPKGELSADTLRIPSAGKPSVEDMAAGFSQITEDLKAVSASLRSALGGPENADKLANIVNGIENVSTRLDSILGGEIKDGQIGKIVDNFASFSEKVNSDSGNMIADLRDSAASLKNILNSNEGTAGDLIANLNVTADNLATITSKMRNGEGFLGKLMTEDSSALDDFSSAMNDIQEVAAKINRGEGTLGQLINDPQTADKINTALDSFSDAAGRVAAFQTEVDFYGYSMMSEDVSKGRFNVTLRPRPHRYYVLGVMSDGFATEAEDPRSTVGFKGEDFGDEQKYTVQFGHVYENALFGKDMGFRIGLKDSTFGIGTDMAFFDGKFELNTDLYDFSGENYGTSEENPHLDITTRLNMFHESFYAVGGYDNVFSEKYGSPFVGVGFRFQDDDFKYLLGQAL